MAQGELKDSLVVNSGAASEIEACSKRQRVDSPPPYYSGGHGSEDPAPLASSGPANAVENRTASAAHVPIQTSAEMEVEAPPQPQEAQVEAERADSIAHRSTGGAAEPLQQQQTSNVSIEGDGGQALSLRVSCL